MRTSMRDEGAKQGPARGVGRETQPSQRDRSSLEDRHQTKGPKTLPVPVEPAGRATRLDAPQTIRALPPGLLSAYTDLTQVPGTQALRSAAEVEPGTAPDRGR